MAIIQRFNYNLVPYYKKNESVRLNQFDKEMTVLHFAIWSYQDRVDLTGYSASISGRKADDTLYFYQCEIVSDPETKEGEHDYKVIQVNVKDQMTVVDGDGIAEITISDGSENLVHTANFYVKVEKCPTEGYEPSETEITVFQDLLNQAQEIAGSLSGIDSRAETAARNAANSATQASNAATSAEQSRDVVIASVATANAAAESATASATNASASATSASQSATSASASATSAETSASNAATSESNVASAVTIANDAAQSASISASNAQFSATNASDSATSASNSADTATVSASQAAGYANQAAASATQAQQDYTNIYNGLSAEIAQRTAEDTVINARIDNIMNLPEGSTTGDAQLADIAIGYDGTVYDTPGNAVRAQAMRTNAIAETFSTTANYEVGEYVWYNGTLYRFTGVHNAGAWTGGDVVATSVGAGVTENANAIRDFIESGGGLSREAKLALLACFRKVAWIDDQGQTYYDNLYDALFSTMTSITAVFSQGGNTIYDTQTLEVLRQYLVVTAVYDDGTEQTVTDYVLSGTLTAGTSTITVTYQGLTTTFNVTVTHNAASLTAVYTQSGTVYETDSLDSLKTDLVVTYYATQQSQGVILSDNDYTLSGTLAVGTSTITATYLNVSATFNVDVTFESYITAVYTSGQNPLYEDDNHTLNDLKSNLVVTAYTAENPQGVVLSDNDYTLSGALNRGNNTITVTYNGMTATFIAVIVGVGTTNYSGALSTWWLPSNVGTATYSDGEITMYFAEGDMKYGMSIADNAQTLWSEVEGKKLRHRVTAYSPDWTGEYSSQVPRNMISFLACLFGSKTMTNYERLRFRTPYTDILTHNESVYEYISNCTLSWFNAGSGAVTPNTSYGIGVTDASTHTIKVTGSETVEVIPSSISAVFNQGSNVIYTSDSLDDLKQFLTVTATYFDNSTLENKNYTLSGTLTAGVSTVAVSYQGLTATFTVNVTNVASGYIEAVFTQPSTTIYTDDALDTLKSDLVVTYYTAPGATGTVLADSAYALRGTLTEGTSVITARYQGLTDTFNVTNVVDFYNIYTRSTEFGTAIKANGGVDTDQPNTNLYPSRLRINPPGVPNYTSRRTLVTNRGHACIYLQDAQTATPTDEYPIPIPLAANHVKVTLLPAGQYIFMHTVPYDPATNTYRNSVSENKQSWTQMDTTTGVFEKNIVRTDETQLFIVTNFKHDSSGTDYTSATEPTLIKIEFSEV